MLRSPPTQSDPPVGYDEGFRAPANASLATPDVVANHVMRWSIQWREFGDGVGLFRGGAFRRPDICPPLDRARDKNLVRGGRCARGASFLKSQKRFLI
jgi:hypothetical protein